jgi:N-acetyl-gamma-glutamylphosphate reductase
MTSPIHLGRHSPYNRTGATGYIGGDALVTLFARHPEFSYSVLVRTTEKAKQVKAQYPEIRIVLGDLDDSPLLQQESAAADIVLRKWTTSPHDHYDCYYSGI